MYYQPLSAKKNKKKTDKDVSLKAVVKKCKILSTAQFWEQASGLPFFGIKKSKKCSLGIEGKWGGVQYTYAQYSVCRQLYISKHSASW